MAELLGDFFTLKDTYVASYNKICWKYFIGSNTLLVHNANSAAASFLLSLSKYNQLQNSKRYLMLAKRALNHTIKQQLPNGSVPYFSKLDPNYGCNNFVDNFHNGFVILDLIDGYLLDPIQHKNLKYNILRALNFQLSMFNKDFSSRRSVDISFPQDIHDISVGILVFTRASYIWPKFGQVAKGILLYALRNFTDDGLFIYQIVLKGLKDRATYLRWNQAWMFLALTEFLKKYACRYLNNIT